MAQQTQLLLQHGTKTPNPHKQFITNLIMQVNQWCQQGKEILIFMDANKDVDDHKSHISCIFEETNLIDLHHHQYPMSKKSATHQRGSSPIDMIIGTKLFVMTLTATWMLPFSNPPLIKGNHCMLGVDFHPGILFGSTPDHPSNDLTRGLNSQN